MDTDAVPRQNASFLGYVALGAPVVA